MQKLSGGNRQAQPLCPIETSLPNHGPVDSVRSGRTGLAQRGGEVSRARPKQKEPSLISGQ